MATLREIRGRIGSVKSTQKITKAMKMVAAAKLRRAQDAIVSARPYARKMKELLQHLAVRIDPELIVSKFPLFLTRPIDKIAIVVVTADRGLCGAFNSNIIKAAIARIQTNYRDLHAAGKVILICVGRKGFDFFLKNNYEIVGKHIGIFAGLNFSRAQDIMTEVTDGFLKGQYDRVEIVYNEFKSVMQQRLAIEQLLPIPREQIVPQAADASREVSTSRVVTQNPYIYEPSSEAIIASLLPKHLNFQMWRILLESNAAEQGARMTAMENATTNATEMIRSLQLSYNKARQAAITKELLEIVSGAEALKKAG